MENYMTYLFDANTSVINEVEIKNDSGNSVPIIVYNSNHPVSNLNPFPVTLGSESIIITGNVNIIPTINVASSPENPVHTHITEVGNSGILSVNYLPIGGNVSILNFPATQTVNGTVNIGNSLTVNGTINVANFPATQTVNGTVNIGNTVFANVINFPASQNVYGTVNIGNFPATQNVSGTFWQTTQPVSGNVSILNFPATQNVSGTVTIQDGGNTITVDGNVNATITGTVTTTVVDGQQDAFGRLRVSEAFTLGDYKHTYGIDPNFRDTLYNGATVTHIANQSAARLATSNNANSYAIHQTKMYHNYMPGKSQLIKTTVNFYANTTNVTKRTGYFDDLNGIYFEQNGDGVLSFVIRTNTSGSPSDTRRITQAQWNHDTCNTTIAGTSTDGSNFGLVGSWNLDITKTQIIFIDFQWLGVGRVRCGFVHNGLMIIAHEFYNDNRLPVVYMSNPNLPIRCEIRNTGTTTGGYFDQICSTVVSEGGYVESGIDFSVDSGQTSQSITVANGVYPIIAIRLKNSFRTYPNRVVVRSGNINVYAEEFPTYWSLIKLADLSNITLANSTWISVSADSAVEYNPSATAITGGDRLDGGIVGTSSPGGSAKGTGTAPVNQPSNAKKNFIAQNQDSSNSEIYVVCGKAIGGTTKVWVDFQWREIY